MNTDSGFVDHRVSGTHMPQVNDFGGAPIAEHDHACCVCWVKPSVLVLNEGRFDPCWSCQRAGWRLVKRRKILRGLHRAAVSTQETTE